MAGYTLKPSDFDTIRKANGFYTRNEIQRYNKFCRFGFLDPYNALLNTREYLFFTKPDLHLFNDSSGSAINYQIKNNPFFIESLKLYKDAYKSLCISLKGNQTPFINILSNMVNSSLELPDDTCDIIETNSTVYGTTIQYQQATLESEQKFDFSLEFLDTDKLEVYRLLKIWDIYEKSKDQISPPNINYTLNKILHDQIAVYKFIVADDGETIIYYAKLYGVFPKNLPRSAFGSLDKNGGLSYSVNFNANFVEDINPLILVDFNNLVQRFIKSSSDIPIYNTSHACINGSWVDMPHVVFQPNPEFGNIGLYKLKWR